MLISNQLDGLYNGVNEQAPEHRLPTQVEEMVNAFPTLDRGLLKRNPTQKLELTDSIDYNSNMWVYEYDRGLAGDSEEKYSISITENGMTIINILSGQVYSKDNGKLIFSQPENKDYLYFINSRGFAGVTIKDTTFIANKNIHPELDPYVTGQGSTSTTDVSESIIWFNKIPLQVYTDFLGNQLHQYDYAPSNLGSKVVLNAGIYRIDVISGRSKILLNIDGKSIEYVKPEETYAYYTKDVEGFHGYFLEEHMSYSEWIENVRNRIENTLDSNYIVDIIVKLNTTGIRVKKIDSGTTLPITLSLLFDEIPNEGDSFITAEESDYYNSQESSVNVETVVQSPSDYLQTGYIWIKMSNPSSAYSYTFSVISDTSNYSDTVSSTTTEGAAQAIADSINNNASANFVAATTGGSVVRVQTVDNAEITDIYVGDSFGDQASFAWSTEVTYATELPKNMPFSGALVKVIGSSNSDSSYWLKFGDSQWKETLGYHSRPNINASTMPHILTRDSDGDTFTFGQYDKWSSSLVGDADTNTPPSFTQDNNVIKDIFFFKNRLGFVTDRTVVFSEVGEYGNFWRTSVAALLDSDRIDTTVDTTIAIQLEYATYLEDSLMLFSDKAQFKLDGGNVLSPKSIQISQTSAYEINKNIRPIFMNNKIFFCAKRGNSTAVMQYSVNGSGRISEANDITSHVQTYIPKNVTRLSGSPINNMLFITSSEGDNDTVWVYKYYDNADTRVQSAWFKWTYNGKIYNAFSLGKNLNILLNRKKAISVEDWVVSSGTWDDNELWDNSLEWVMDSDSLVGANQFETTPIFPQDYKETFLDDFTSDDNQTIIPTTITLSEWVAGSGKTKDIRGHLKFKTVQISSEDDSVFEVVVEDKKRNTTRKIASKYTVDRKPMVYGDAKNIILSIVNTDNVGFRINTVSYEGNLNKRDTRR